MSCASCGGDVSFAAERASRGLVSFTGAHAFLQTTYNVAPVDLRLCSECFLPAYQIAIQQDAARGQPASFD